MAHPELTVRPAVRRDLSEIDLLLSRSYPALLKDHYPPSLLVTAVPLISRANPRLIDSGTYFVVCEEGGRIVGAGGWTWAAPPGARQRPGVASIRHVVTDHRLIRKGIGRRLMEHIFSTARTEGVETLDCFSTRMAVPFYSAFGFREIGPMSVRLAEGIDFPAIRMQRSLSGLG